MDKARILVVEDEPVVALDISTMLLGMGFEVLPPVSTGSLAVEAAREYKPDLILMDTALPGGIDGIEAAVAIRARDDIPIIYMTANADPATVERARETVPSAYLNKPINQSDLFSNIDAALFRYKNEMKRFKSAERLIGILRDIHDVIYAVDASLLFSFISPAIFVLGGYAVEEVLGLSLTGFIHPDDLPAVHSWLEKARRGVPGPLECRFVNKSREHVFIRITGQPIYRNGIFEGICGVISAVTGKGESHEEIRESCRALGTLLDYLPGMAYRCRNDKFRTMEYVSGGCAALTGYACDDLIENRRIAYADIIRNDERERVINGIRSALRDGSRFEDFYRIRTAAGGEKWVWEQGRGLFGVNGSLRALEGFICDITEQKTLEQALRESEGRYRLLAQNTSDVIWTMDLEGRTTYVSPSSTELTGYTPEETMDLPLDKALTPECAERVFLLIGEELKKPREERRRSMTMELQMYTKSGSVIDIEVTTSWLFDEKGEMIGIQGSSRDITARKKKEEALRVSESRFRALVENAPVTIITLNRHGTILFVNHTELGPPGKVMGTSVYDYIKPGRRDEFGKALSAVFQKREGVRLRMEMRRGDGTPAFFENQIGPVELGGRVVAALLVSMDITERMKAEENYRLVVENANTMILIIQDGILKYTNPMSPRITGYAPEELISRSFLDFVHPADREIIAERYLQNLMGEKLPQLYDYRILHKNGDIRWVSINGTLMEFEGRPAMLYFLTDITERRNAEEKYRLVVENANSLIVIIQEGMVKFANPSLMRLTGYSLDEVISEPFFRFIHVDDREAAASHYAQNLLGKKYSDLFDVRIIKKDGGTLWTSIAGALTELDGRPAMLYFLTDITARKAAEGMLTASLQEKEILLKEIHHRVKNNFQVITSLLSLQRRRIKDPETAAIFDQSQNRIRAMSLIHEKLYQSKNLAGIDLAEYVSTLVHELYDNYRMSKGVVALRFSLQSLIIDIEKAIPCGLILNELVTNAFKYAFPPDLMRHPSLNLSLRTQNGNVEMVVRDNGVGLPPEIELNRTGSLGLMMVPLLAGQLGGTIECERGEGTSYTLRFGL